MRDLIHRVRDRLEQKLSLEALRPKLVASRESGIGSRTIDEVFTGAQNWRKEQEFISAQNPDSHYEIPPRVVGAL